MRPETYAVVFLKRWGHLVLCLDVGFGVLGLVEDSADDLYCMFFGLDTDDPRQGMITEVPPQMLDALLSEGLLIPSKGSSCYIWAFSQKAILIALALEQAPTMNSQALKEMITPKNVLAYRKRGGESEHEMPYFENLLGAIFPNAKYIGARFLSYNEPAEVARNGPPGQTEPCAGIAWISLTDSDNEFSQAAVGKAASATLEYYSGLVTQISVVIGEPPLFQGIWHLDGTSSISSREVSSDLHVGAETKGCSVGLGFDGHNPSAKLTDLDEMITRMPPESPVIVVEFEHNDLHDVDPMGFAPESEDWDSIHNFAGKILEDVGCQWPPVGDGESGSIVINVRRREVIINFESGRTSQTLKF